MAGHLTLQLLSTCHQRDHLTPLKGDVNMEVVDVTGVIMDCEAQDLCEGTSHIVSKVMDSPIGACEIHSTEVSTEWLVLF